jgi:hypothetical protein
MSDTITFFPGTKVERLQAAKGSRIIVWVGLGIVGLMMLGLIAIALTSRNPTDTLIIVAAVLAMFGAAYGIMLRQSRKTLAALDRIVAATGMNAGAAGGLVPGTVAYPVVVGTFQGGALEARSLTQSSGGPFTRAIVTGTGNALALHAWLVQDAANYKVNLLAASVDGTTLRADLSGVLGQPHVAETVIRLAARLKPAA